MSLDRADWEQQMDNEKRRAEEERCACTSTTSLFDLCPRCTDKAWHSAYMARKAEPLGNTYEYHGPASMGADGKLHREQRLK